MHPPQPSHIQPDAATPQFQALMKTTENTDALAEASDNIFHPDEAFPICLFIYALYVNMTISKVGIWIKYIYLLHLYLYVLTGSEGI